MCDHTWVPDSWLAYRGFAGNDPWIVNRERCDACGEIRPAWRDCQEGEHPPAEYSDGIGRAVPRT
jgi:hypothetical protein